MSAVFAAARQRLVRWFPGFWAMVTFVCALAGIAIYIASRSAHVYCLETKLATDRPTELAVSFDDGRGFRNENTRHLPIPASLSSQVVTLPIPVSRLSRLRLVPVRGPAVLSVTALSVRTISKIWTQPRSYRVFNLAELQTEPRVEKALPGGGKALSIEATAHGVPSVITVAPPRPLELGFSWLYFVQLYAECALAWLLLWVGIVEASHRLESAQKLPSMTPLID